MTCKDHFSAATQKCYIHLEDMFAMCHTCQHNPMGTIKGLRADLIICDDLDPVEGIRDYNVGDSDYAKHTIQPWDIWKEYKLNPWEADIIKRILRNKSTDSRRLDLEKVVHVTKELIRQIDEG